MDRWKIGRADPKKREWPAVLNIAFLGVFIALIVLGIYLVRDKLLYNADEMGTYLAESYSREEENRIEVYEMLLKLESLYIGTRVHEDASAEELAGALAEYDSYAANVLGADIIDPYAVIGGQIVAANPWSGDSSYDYASKAWYQKAVEADGGIIFTDVYADVITGEQLVTVSMELEEPGDVLAFNILMENFHTHANRASMPDGSSYFLFDGSGELIYSVGAEELSDEEKETYAALLLEGVRSGEFDSYRASIEAPEGGREGIYYHNMTNGWLSVITYPVNLILYGEWNSVISVLTAIFILLAVVIAVMMFREYAEKRKVKYISDTLKILGDTYYAIYRINFEDGTYETIKSSPDVRDVLGKRGDYRHLIKTVGSVVEKNTYEEFEESFSVQNIRKLVEKQIYEFGGDYQRLFGEERKWVSIKIVYSEGLGLDEVIMCYREIDDEKKKELQRQEILESALENAKQAAHRKSMFFSNMSHDMRTPLNAVIGMTKLARQNMDDPEKLTDYLSKIERSGSQLLALINDVLDMSRLEQGSGSSMEYEAMDLGKCVEESAALFQEQARQEKKELRVSTHVAHPTVYCDSARLTQILNNLLSNAFKYSGEGASVSLELMELEQKEHRGKYRITVQDTGIGMSESFLENIFEPFARETRFAPTKTSGTGLGMPIVKSLVQQMSGEIFVKSKLGEGSTFTVLLPLEIAQGQAGEEPKSAGAGAAHMQEAAAPYSLEGKRILVAEDNELNMEIAVEFLSMLGAAAIQAWNGQEAVEKFEASQVGMIDAVLMDMQMPVMDGCEACRRIRALQRADARTVPIIAVTANAFAEDVARTTEAGMNAHISKPIDFKLLCEVLSKLS